MIPVGEGPVETFVMPSDHQNERTHVLALPRELLVLIFKAQSSIIDKSHRTLLPWHAPKERSHARIKSFTRTRN